MPVSLQSLVERLNQAPCGEPERCMVHRRRLVVAVTLMARALVRIFAKKHGTPEQYRLMARTALEQAKWWQACHACHQRVLEAERRPEYEI